MLFRSPAWAVAFFSLPRPRRAGALIAAAGLITVGVAAAPAASAAVRPDRVASAHSASSAARRAGQPRLPLSAQRPVAGPGAAKLPRDVRQLCPPAARAGQMECMTLLRTNTRHYLGVVRDQTPTGYGPAQLQSAYNLTSASASGGTGETVAVVAAYDDPDATSDLAIYRSQYGLAACNTTTGAGCVIKENEEGQASPLPMTEPLKKYDWAATESADLDMVSAVCPNCRILLIEASSALIPDLGTAENTAASSGAAFVANSWNSGEYSTEDYYDNEYFNHPGVAITVASGELGYGTTWPTSSQYVTAVGGTSLTQDSGVTRGWTESVWNDGNGHATGSGCSMLEPKPAWQTLDDTSPTGCLNRTENDVAAVADPQTGVAMYDTFGSYTGWSEVGGTSVAAPIIASVYALAGSPTAGTYPASYLYQSGHAADLYDVTTGSNGTCEANRQYLCNGETGYDGPTGLGTPDGTAAFTNSVTGNVVTLTDPGVQDEEAGTPVFVAVAGSDSSGLALTYSATGLPSGLSMGPASGHITGTLSSTKTGSYKVTVTAKDSTGATGSVKISMVVMKSLATDFDGVAGAVDLDMKGGKCLDDYHNISTQGAVVDEWMCNSSGAQNWEFEPGGEPGGPGVLVINKKCLDLKGGATAPFTVTVLDTCDGASTQDWEILGSDGDLYNYAAGLCLADPGGDTKNGRQLWVWNCDGGDNQAWIPPASPIQSGVTGMCVDDNRDVTTNGNKVQVWGCNNTGAQRWTAAPDQTLRLGGKCLTVTGSSLLDGATVVLDTCGTTSNQQWTIENGELINENSGRCLADPGNSTTAGTALVQEDCYGLAGEIWAVT